MQKPVVGSNTKLLAKFSKWPNKAKGIEPHEVNDKFEHKFSISDHLRDERVNNVEKINLKNELRLLLFFHIEQRGNRT